jgi:hypothetical protein
MAYQCIVCGAQMAELKCYILVHGIIRPYCDGVECQEQMKQTEKHFYDRGIYALKVKEFGGK